MLSAEPMRESVLVVDDEPAMRDGLKALLGSAGIEVVACEGVEEALEALSGSAFDLVLADLSLDGADGRQGFDLLDRVLRLGLGVPVVVFTARDGEIVRSEAISRGAEDLWGKSLPVETLIDRVRGFRRDH